MFKNRSLQLSFVKPNTPDTELTEPIVDPKEIEEIARRSALDLTKLVVGAVGALMILKTSLSIVEDKLTSDDS